MKEKFERWVNKSIDGNKENTMLFLNNGKWWYREKKNTISVSMMYISVNTGKGFTKIHHWREGDTEPLTENNMMIVFKNNKKMIVNIDDTFYAFGVEEGKDDAAKIILIYEISGIVNIVGGTKTANGIEVVDYIADSKYNCILDCIFEAFDCAQVEKRGVEDEQ